MVDRLVVAEQVARLIEEEQARADEYERLDVIDVDTESIRAGEGTVVAPVGSFVMYRSCRSPAERLVFERAILDAVRRYPDDLMRFADPDPALTEEE
jgi:hypothetical protein